MKTGNVLIGNVPTLSKAKQAGWKKVHAHIKKYESDTDKLLAAFYKEAKAKGLTSKADKDKLWQSKYGDKLVDIMTIYRKEHKVILNNVFKIPK